ncbi:glycoside hydrolase [Violaceomyces palustris]|uniref:Glycoside hydrolase n=1 Tax=Violaceomyces palustris TaxID=1673888 RepID=A0ACD0NR28_9BASI|nr:glycoside hydrolase [Violaceomyces palustris]
MRFLPRDTDLTTLAGTLSLAVANYKPIPQLPLANSTSLTGGSQNGGASSMMVQGKSFKVQNGDYEANHSVKEWGVPSTLYVSVDDQSSSSSNSTTSPVHNNKDAATPKKLATTTVGNGCPLSNAYTPNGGWDNLPAPTFPAFDSVKANAMRYRQQQGVNLGSWFVQEGWMETAFMACATGTQQAEFDIVNGFGTSQAGLVSAQAYMEQHWDTWITEQDFINLANMGINTVRLPIGYWSVGPYFTQNSPFSPYASVYSYSWRYVARAINWAAKYDIGVILDLHGAYGSQNGQAHSGLNDGVINWYNSYNQGLTTQVLLWLAQELSAVTNIVGIQMLNEPQDRASYWSWLSSVMDQIRSINKYTATVPLYFHDAFNLKKGAQFVANRSDFVVQDHHSYYVYTPDDIATSAQGHVSQIKGTILNEMNAQSSVARRNLIVGEWSCALSSLSLAQSSNPTKDQTDFCTSQAQVWQESTAGFSFWSYKMLNCNSNSGWCFKSAVKNYLPGYFNSWGLAIPTLPTTTSNVLAANATTVNRLNLNVSTTSSSSSSSTPTSTLTPARVGKVITEKDQAYLDQQKTSDPPRVGMVIKQRSLRGSLASMARSIVLDENPTRRQQSTSVQQKTTSQVASKGYSDGFLTAKILASELNLSRLGFKDQYLLDSWNAHMTTGLYRSQDSQTYTDQFRQGLQDAENRIASLATSLLSS